MNRRGQRAETRFNTLSTLAMVLLVVATFPTGERLANTFRNRISSLD